MRRNRSSNFLEVDSVAMNEAWRLQLGASVFVFFIFSCYLGLPVAAFDVEPICFALLVGIYERKSVLHGLLVSFRDTIGLR